MSSECIGLKLIATQQQQRHHVTALSRFSVQAVAPHPGRLPCCVTARQQKDGVRPARDALSGAGLVQKRDVQFPVSSASTSTALSFSTLASFEVEEALETNVVSVEVVVGD